MRLPTIATVVFVMAANTAADEPIRLAAGGRTCANAWNLVSFAPATAPAETASSRPLIFDVIDPWGQVLWTGATRQNTARFYSGEWADGTYTIRFQPGGEQSFAVDSEYFGRVRARAHLLMRWIDEKRNTEGIVPDKDLQGASNLLQRIVTLHAWREPPEVVERHLTFCEQVTRFRTRTATARILGSGAATFEGYEGPYRPGRRERSMMFVPPDGVCDFGTGALRRLRRWGYKPADVRRLFITHEHADHFDAGEIARLAAEREQVGLPPPTVYSGKTVCDALRAHFKAAPPAREVPLVELKPGDNAEAGELQVKAVEARHGTGHHPLCYILRWRGITLYYGTDTGYPPAATFAALAVEKFDLFAHECTHVSNDDGREHADLGDIRLLAGKLRVAGAIAPWTRLVTIHQTHEGPAFLPDIAYHQAGIGFEPGYDGMPIPLAYPVAE